MRCVICVKPMRYSVFPFSLFFWRPKAMFYSFLLDETNICTYLCREDFNWAIKNKTAAESIIYGRIRNFEEK